MPLNKLAATSCLALAVSVAPFAQSSDGPGISVRAAFAKDHGGGNGNGGGNGGGKSGSNDGGKSSGKSGGNNRGSQRREARSIERAQKDNFFMDVFTTITGNKTKSGKSQLSVQQPRRPAAKLTVNKPVEPVTTLTSVPLEKPKARPIQARLAGLNSLNRNYRAYLNSSDPRMAAIRDYAVAYATYELANGVDTLPTDAALNDEALLVALEAASKPGTVIDDDILGWAKTMLGVGSAVGKIDEIREELAAAAPAGPVTDLTADLGEEVVTAPDSAEPPLEEDVVLPTDPKDTASVTP